MKQIEYNLLEERWVRVRGQDYTVQEVSLPDALLHAHEYRDLAGELPTQDAAMLRLLLAAHWYGISLISGVMTGQASIWPALSAKTNGNWSIIMKPVKKNFSTYQMISVKKMM